MYQFIIQVAPQDRDIREVVFGRNNTAGIPRDFIGYGQRRINASTATDPQEISDELMYFANDPATAEQIARSLSSTYPTRTVYVSKVEQHVQCAAQPPVIAKLTEKGLVPQ